MSSAVPILIVDRQGELSADYDVAGSTACGRCGSTVALSATALQPVNLGHRLPVCLHCAIALIDRGVITWPAISIHSGAIWAQAQHHLGEGQQ